MIGTKYNEENLFQQKLPDQLWDNLRTFIINLRDLPVWKNRPLASTVFGGKQSYAFWETIFETGKTSEGTEVLASPINVVDMIKK